MLKADTIDFSIDGEEIYLSSMKKVRKFDDVVQGLLTLVSIPALALALLFMMDKHMM